MTTGAEFHAKTNRFGDQLAKDLTRAVERAAQTVKAIITTNIGTTRLRGMGGARVGVKYDDVEEHIAPRTWVRAYGPLHILERDTRPHKIPRPGKGGKYGFVAFPNGGVRRGPIMHPGTKGQHPFERGVEQSATVVPPQFHRAFRDSLARVWPG